VNAKLGEPLLGVHRDLSSHRIKVDDQVFWIRICKKCEVSRTAISFVRRSQGVPPDTVFDLWESVNCRRVLRYVDDIRYHVESHRLQDCSEAGLVYGDFEGGD